MRTTIPLTRLTILPHSRDTKVPGTPMRYRSVLPEILQALHRPFACGPIPASCRGLTLAVTRETMKFIEHRQSPSQPRGRIARTAALFRDPFRDPFQGADPITSDQYCRVPRIRAAASGRVEP